MDKKDIYEHLAKIYLDASSKTSKKKKKSQYHPRILQKIFFSGIIVAVIAFIFLAYPGISRKINQEVALVICFDPVKINFHFDPAKKETYSINLNNLDLSRYKRLGFGVRKTHHNDSLALRIEFANVFKERSEVYIKGIPDRWQDYRIDFAEFKNISDWSRMSNLSFIVEEWNVKGKKGVVYIDNVRLLR